MLAGLFRVRLDKKCVGGSGKQQEWKLVPLLKDYAKMSLAGRSGGGGGGRRKVEVLLAVPAWRSLSPLWRLTDPCSLPWQSQNTQKIESAVIPDKRQVAPGARFLLLSFAKFAPRADWKNGIIRSANVITIHHTLKEVVQLLSVIFINGALPSS